MTRKDIDSIISIICPNDEDFEKPIISPAYLKNELEALVLDQEPCENCCNGNQIEKAKLCQKSYIAGMEHKQEPCEDAISRTAAIRIAEQGQIQGYEWQFKKLIMLPPITPQPKVGRWIMSDDGLYRPMCNNCGAHPWKGYIPTVEEATEAFKYCPHCGCAMQEVNNE